MSLVCCHPTLTPSIFRRRLAICRFWQVFSTWLQSVALLRRNYHAWNFSDHPNRPLDTRFGVLVHHGWIYSYFVGACAGSSSAASYSGAKGFVGKSIDTQLNVSWWFHLDSKRGNQVKLAWVPHSLLLGNKIISGCFFQKFKHLCSLPNRQETNWSLFCLRLLKPAVKAVLVLLIVHWFDWTSTSRFLYSLLKSRNALWKPPRFTCKIPR